MDPKKQLTDLDPKLKEVYERVMSTNVASAPTPAPAPQQTLTQTTPAQPVASSNPVPSPVHQALSPVHDSQEKKDNVQVFTGHQKPEEKPKEEKTKSKGSLRIFLIPIAVVFFIGYALFWVKFFKLPMPIPLPF